MIILCHTNHYSFFFLYIASLFYNIRRVAYQMTVITSVLTLSRHLTYCMAYDDSMCLRRHITFGVYYYFPYAYPYFLSVVTDTSALTLYLPMSKILVTRVFSPINISAYKCFSRISFFVDFMLDKTSSSFPTWSLIEGGPICNVYMCFQPIITSWNFMNRDL